MICLCFDEADLDLAFKTFEKPVIVCPRSLKPLLNDQRFHIFEEIDINGIWRNYLSEETKSFLRTFDIYQNMALIFGFYHFLQIKVLLKSRLKAKKIWCNFDQNKSFSGPCYFNSTFEGGEIDASTFKENILPILSFEGFLLEELYLRRKPSVFLKSLKLFFQKIAYVLLLKIFSKQHISNSLKEVKNKDLLIYRTDSQLSIFNLYNFDNKYRLFKVPSIGEFSLNSIPKNDLSISIRDILLGLKDWFIFIKNLYKENSKFLNNHPHLFNLFAEVSAFSIESSILKHSYDNAFKEIFKFKKMHNKSIVCLEFRSPQASLISNIAKRNNIDMTQVLAFDIFDMWIDIPESIVSDRIIVPSNFYKNYFNKFSFKETIVKNIFNNPELQFLQTKPNFNNLEELYIILPGDFSIYRQKMITNILKSISGAKIKITLRPHPRFKNYRLLDPFRPFIIDDTPWNALSLSNALVVTFYSAAIFELVSRKINFAIIDEGIKSFIGFDLSNKKLRANFL